MTGAVGTAFGFAVESAEPIPGLNGCVPSAGSPALRVTVHEPVEPPSGGDLISRRATDGRLLGAVSRHPDGSYRLYGAGFGTYEVAADASAIACHPAEDAPPWLWQRFLMSQALPLAATLCGVEPFHAGGIVVDGRVVAISGQSGAGKSSLTLTLAARGHGFHTDDVLAVARGEDGVLSPAGPGAANVRDRALRELVARGEPPFGRVLGETADGVRALVTRAGEAHPLGAIYFVDHGPAHADVTFEPTGDPQLLLGHTFNQLVRTPERLAGQLATCAAIARHAALFRLRVPHGTAVAELAVRLESHALAVFAT